MRTLKLGHVACATQLVFDCNCEDGHKHKCWLMVPSFSGWVQPLC